MTNCNPNAADYLELVYQCIPGDFLWSQKFKCQPINLIYQGFVLKANPIQSFLKSYTCGEPIRNVPNGIIQSPNYPNYGNQNCAITITPPADSAIRVFIIDLSLDVNENDLADDS